LGGKYIGIRKSVLLAEIQFLFPPGPWVTKDQWFIGLNTLGGNAYVAKIVKA